jgi:3-phenylpropionate/cinnamic acid dioxygenase small subunit
MSGSSSLDEWLDLLAADVAYTMPVRMIRERDNPADASDAVRHFSEDLETLRLRVKRLKTEFAWAEDPPSRTRRFVSNVRVADGERGGELDVRSYLLVYRSRGGSPAAELISGERHDVLARKAGGWRIKRRVVVVDQATLGARNLAIFL